MATPTRTHTKAPAAKPKTAKPAASPAAAASAPEIAKPHIRPGYVGIFGNAGGVQLVLRRDGDAVHFIGEGGYFSSTVDDLVEEDSPEPGSALETMADHIASGFALHADTRPFATSPTPVDSAKSDPAATILREGIRDAIGEEPGESDFDLISRLKSHIANEKDTEDISNRWADFQFKAWELLKDVDFAPGEDAFARLLSTIAALVAKAKTAPLVPGVMGAIEKLAVALKSDPEGPHKAREMLNKLTADAAKPSATPADAEQDSIDDDVERGDPVNFPRMLEQLHEVLWAAEDLRHEAPIIIGETSLERYDSVLARQMDSLLHQANELAMQMLNSAMIEGVQEVRIGQRKGPLFPKSV